VIRDSSLDPSGHLSRCRDLPLNLRVDGRETGNSDHGGLWIASDVELAREEVRPGVQEGVAIVKGGMRRSRQEASAAWQLAEAGVPRCRRPCVPSSASNRHGRELSSVIRDQSRAAPGPVVAGIVIGHPAQRTL
jgi:hypothetical protein